VFGSNNPAALGVKIAAVYPADHLPIAGSAWFIVSEGTAKDISDKLAITDGPVNGLVVAVSGYYGRAPSNIWEWLAARVKAGSNG
jgi:hypothetical protein